MACNKLPYPTLFPSVDSSVKPIKLPSRKYFIEERKVIAREVVSLLKDDIIMKSKSPWRAQLVIVKGKKWRMCVDYSNTINRFTEEDAFPLPRIDKLVNQLALHKYFFQIRSKIYISSNSYSGTGYEIYSI